MKDFRKLIICLILLLTKISAKLTVNRETSWLTDEYGRYRFIHGINEIYKEAPYHPDLETYNVNSSLVDRDFVDLKRWGFNSLRLYIAWEGFEPT